MINRKKSRAAKEKKNRVELDAGWLMHVILSTQEAEIRRISV
jgi:hypothetical protein